MPGVYIGFLHIDPAIEAKIRDGNHQVTGSEVREALLYPAKAHVRWEDHPAHGLRLLARGTTASGRIILAWLQPIDETDGTWALRTARGSGT